MKLANIVQNPTLNKHLLFLSITASISCNAAAQILVTLPRDMMHICNLKIEQPGARRATIAGLHDVPTGHVQQIKGHIFSAESLISTL